MTGANTLTYSASSAAMKKKYTTLKPSINLIKLFIFVTDNENEKASAFLPFLIFPERPDLTLEKQFTHAKGKLLTLLNLVKLTQKQR